MITRMRFRRILVALSTRGAASRLPAVGAAVFLGATLGVCWPAAEARAADAVDGLTLDRAVALALARNRDVIAAKLEIEAAQLDRLAAGMYPNPVFSYSLGNIVLGRGNPDNANAGAPRSPSPLSQPVHSVGLSETLDVWAKRSARMRAADRGIEYHKWLVEDALREIVYAVRSAYADVLREHSEAELAREMRERHGETVRLSRARFNAGEISEAELRKIELEGLKYENAVIDAELQRDIAHERLSALLALPSVTDLPPVPNADAWPAPTLPLANLIDRALAQRPDLRAAREVRLVADASRDAARREAYPDLTVGVSYSHSSFLVSGDNPNSLGLSLSLPLPVFDRNQAGIGRAELEMRARENDSLRLELLVRHEVAEAHRRVQRAQALIAVFLGGGMLDRAEHSLRVAEKSYKAGAISLLELLEAQRTYIETRAQYLRAQHEGRQSTIDLTRATGSQSLP